MPSLFARIAAIAAMSAASLGGALYTAWHGMPPPVPPSYQVAADTTPSLTAASWLVFVPETGEVLYAAQPDTPRPIASVTKLVSGSVFYENAPLDATTTITWSDVLAEGRAGRFSYGDEYTYHQLLFPLLLESSNDAAAVIERVDTTLIDRMNALAAETGLTKTHFADASGLSEQNISTARELAQLMSRLWYEEPHIFDITRLPEYYLPEVGWLNNSPFVTESGYQGGKHGYIYAANRTTVGFFTEVLEPGVERTLGYVLLGSDNLATDMAALRAHVTSQTRYQ